MLYENRNGLSYIYNKNAIELGLLKSTALKLIRAVVPSIDIIDDKFMHRTFVMSLQTIIDDIMDQKKYFYLSYNEFLEYISRISIKLYHNEI